MPIKKLEYYKTGSECARCGVPFYSPYAKEAMEWDADNPPRCLRSNTNPLYWKWVDKKDARVFNANGVPAGYHLESVFPEQHGVFCGPCSKREDRWMGIVGAPHEQVNGTKLPHGRKR